MTQWLEHIFDFSNTLNASITASWLILVVIGLRLLMKKAPKWVNVALWGIVALRLLMPFSIESAFSLIPSAHTISEQVLQTGPVSGAKPAYLEIVTNPSFGNTVSVELDNSISTFQWDLMEMNIVWFAGMALMAVYTAASYLSLQSKLRTAVILRDNIFQCETVSSPFVLGILKPKIYLPYTMDGSNLNHVVAHEQAHIRRKDHWWKPLGFLLLTVHWFNPLMWLAYILLCRDIELACDEKVIAELGSEQRADYTQALVACAVNRRMISACPLAFGEVGVKERVKSVLNYRKASFWIVLAAVIVCIIVALCFLTDPVIEEPDLAFLNYQNAISIVADAGEMPAIYCPSSDDGSEASIQIGNVSGADLANQLDKWDWTVCDPPREALPSPGSVEFVISDDYRITVHQRKPGSLHQYAVVRYQDDIRYYRIDRNDYPDAVALIHAPAQQPSILRAEIFEIHDGYFIVEPVEGSSELHSADKIEVPIRNMSPSPEPQVGDILQIEYDGEILETYPAKLNNVYHIALEQTIHSSSTMIPTDSDLLGCSAGALLVPIDGNVYRYELTEGNPEGVTVDELLYTFTEETHIECIVWEVYSLKEYPDKTAVLMLSGTNSAWLCRYSPPGRCADNALNDAIAAGYVIMVDGIATHGQDIWYEFYELVQQGKAASVTVVHYFTLDPERCDSAYYEVYSQDYPSLYECHLEYDGKTFTLTQPESNDVRIRTFAYLMKYDNTEFYSQSSITPGRRYDYILTHDNRVTWEQIWNGLISSYTGADIDHYSIYSERIP